MNLQKEFQIDFTLIKCLEKKNLSPILIIKSTFHFITTLHNEIDNMEDELLLNIIEEYKEFTVIPLSNKNKRVIVTLTKNQNKLYNKISRENRVYIINNLISISINNSNYTNHIFKNIDIKKDIIINDFTFFFFLSFKNETLFYKEIIVTLMKSLLFKLHSGIEKKFLDNIYYKNLIIKILKQYEKECCSYEYLENPKQLYYTYEGLGKIYFIMACFYNLKITDSRMYFKKYHYQYEKKIIFENEQILISKYNNDLNKFIKNELELSKENPMIQFEQLKYFLWEMHPREKETFIVNTALSRFLEMI